MESYLTSFHQALADFDGLGFDVDPIFVWANCADPIFRRHRKKFVGTLPALTLALTEEPSSFNLLELSATVGRGDPLVDRLCELLSIREQSVCYLFGKSIPDLGRAWLESPLELLQAIDLCPREMLPTSPTDWTIMRKLWEGTIIRGQELNPGYRCPAKRICISG